MSMPTKSLNGKSSRQCELLDLPRSTFYHVSTPVSEADLELMKLIDRGHMELPFYGSWRMIDWLDNVFVERLWRSVKYEEVYLKAYDNVGHAWQSLDTYFKFYNERRRHQSLDRLTADSVYY